MLPAERRNQIKTLINTHHHMKISELSQLLNVSEMTIHRDIKILIDEGAVIKTFGGISSFHTSKQEKSDHCALCGRQNHSKMSFRLILANHQIEAACCAHCGLLRKMQLNDQVVQAICNDFLTQTTISAPLAWYVTDTTINMECCQPQILTFEHQQHAEQFVTGFGGKVHSYQEIMAVLQGKMDPDTTTCH